MRESPEYAYASEPPTPKFARPRPPPPPVPPTRAERGSRQNESAPDSKEKDDEVIEQNAPDSKENENDSKDDAVIAQNAPDSEQNESAPESKKSEQDASKREEEIEQDVEDLVEGTATFFPCTNFIAGPFCDEAGISA